MVCQGTWEEHEAQRLGLHLRILFRSTAHCHSRSSELTMFSVSHLRWNHGMGGGVVLYFGLVLDPYVA